MNSLDNEIRNDNKIPGSPGCDSFTRPEEISALSKFLGSIKRNQEQNLSLDNSLEDIPGKTTGLFPEINSLSEDYVKLSSGEREKIEKLEDTFVPLDASVFGDGIDSLPQHLVGLNAGNFELNLEDEIVTIEDKRDIELGDELVAIEDSRDTKLEDKLITIEDKRNINLEDELVTIEDKREVGLENTKEELEVNNKIKNLEDEKVKLKVDNEIDKLSKTRIDLSDIRKTKTLEDTKVELGGNLIDPKLNEEKLNLDVNDKDVSLSDKKLKIEVGDSVKKLENTLIDLDVDTEITLEEDLVNLEINEQKLSIGEKQEKLIVENNIENISEYRDNLDVVEPIKALDNSIINLVKDDLFPELDDTKIDLQDVKTKTSLKDEIVKLAKKEDEEITSLGDAVSGLDTTSSIIKQISDNIVKLNIEENDIKLEKEVIELDNTKKLTDLNDNIVKLNIEENDIKLEKEVVELNNTTESKDLNNTVVELNNVDTVSNLSNTVITLDNTDDISELGNILVDLENVNTVNELENDVVTIDLGDNVTELSNVIELLIGTDSTTSLSDYIEKIGDSISPANQNNHDWFDNTENSNENLIYSEKDKQKLSTIIGNSDLPIESRDGNYDWVDNRVEGGKPKTIDLGKIESKQVIENINTNVSNDIIPDPDSEYDWFDNREGSGEELLYEVGDEEKLKTTINDNDLPLENRIGNYDWIDNTVDINGNPRTIDLNKIKSKQDKKIVDTDVSNDIIPDPDSEYDWFDNREGSGEELLHDEEDRVELSDTISNSELPLLSQTGEDKHDWVDNRVEGGKPKTIDLNKIKSKQEKKEIITDISDNDLPLLNQTGKKYDHDWFDNREGSSEELLYNEDNRIRLKTPTTVSYNDDEGNQKTELDYGDNNGISLDLIPERSRGSDYDWLNNTVDEDGNPKTLNLDKIESKQETKAVNTDISDNDLPLLNQEGGEKDHTWLNNETGGFELGDEFLEMKSSIVGQSSKTIPTDDIPNRPTAGEEEYKYKFLELGQIETDNSLNYKYVKSLSEIDLYNKILNFSYSFIPPSTIGLDEENRTGTRLNNDLETEYSRFGNENFEPEWVSFIKAITTAYLYPGNDDKLDSSLEKKLESFKTSIQSLIRSNKLLWENSGRPSIDTNISEDELPIYSKEGETKDHDWFDNREGSSEELLYNEDNRIRLKTPTTVSYKDGEDSQKTELDYGVDGISLDLIPEKNRGEDYNWFDNREGSSEELPYSKEDVKKFPIPDETTSYNYTRKSSISLFNEKDDEDVTESRKTYSNIDVPETIDKKWDWFNNLVEENGRPKDSGVELPNYMKHGPRSKLPEFNFDIENLSNNLSRNYSVSSFLRFGAENTVGAAFDMLFEEDKFEWHTPILKEARRKLLEETLALLLWGRDELEKLLKSQKHRLPGDDGGLGFLGNMVSGDLSAKGLVKSTLSEFLSPETDKPTNRPQEKTENWYGYSFKGNNAIYKYTSGRTVSSSSDNKYNYKSHYLQGLGINTTLTELMNMSSTGVNSVEEFYNLLKTSPYFTTSNKVTTTESGYKVMTLDSNAHWEIILEPYIGRLNNWYTFLPLMEEINIRNGKLHGIETGYNHWIPVTSFELQKERLSSKSLGLFNGEIIFPISMEFSNEFRITIADDQYKSWRNYFERCAQASVYSSTPVVKDYTNGDISINNDNKTKLITINKKYHLVAPYKNITFRCKILVMTPQLSTINRYDLLLTLKDISEERSGEIDSSGTDLSLGFSIVGENPGDELSEKDMSRFSNVTKESGEKINTWREAAESKGYGAAITNSLLSIL